VSEQAVEDAQAPVAEATIAENGTSNGATAVNGVIEELPSIALPTRFEFNQVHDASAAGFPVAAITSGVVAAAVWACMMPGSPIGPYLRSEHAQVLVPLFIAVGGVVAATISASLLVSCTRPDDTGAAKAGMLRSSR
jgi:hypothetical protein